MEYIIVSLHRAKKKKEALFGSPFHPSCSNDMNILLPSHPQKWPVTLLSNLLAPGPYLLHKPVGLDFTCIHWSWCYI